MAKRTIGKIYVFKVALAMDKRIWRRIAIRVSQTLDDLHEAIFDAFDREEEHLYSFYVAPFGRSIKTRRRDRTGVEYTHPYNCEQHSVFGFFDKTTRHNAKKTRIGSLTLKAGQKFSYLFDFGDSWWHEIAVEQTNGESEKGRYPRIIEKHGDSPPQYPDWDDEECEDE